MPEYSVWKPPTISERAAVGLPDDAFVFSAFHPPLKIRAELFDIWMRLLKSIERSVLWLSPGTDAVQRNLHREAEARGIAPDRLVFAPVAPAQSEHLARLSLADLYLDPLPYNASS